MVNPVITKVAFPVFSRMQNESDRLKKGYLKVLQMLSTVNFPIMAGLAVVAPIAVPEMFGEQWLSSIILIQILTVVGLLRSTGNPVGSLLLSKGRADLGFKWNIALTITQIPGLYLGAKLGGTVGVAIAFAALQCVYAILNYLVLIRILLGPCLGEYVTSMWHSLWMSAVMAVTVVIINIFLKGQPPLLSLMAQIIFGIFVYCALIIYCQQTLMYEIKKLMATQK